MSALEVTVSDEASPELAQAELLLLELEEVKAYFFTADRADKTAKVRLGEAL